MGFATAAAVVGTAVALKGQQDAKKAQQQAADEQRRAAAESAELIGQAGAASEKDILEAQKLAAQEIGLGATEAISEIEPFTAATGGYDIAKESILSGMPVSDDIAESIRLAATQAPGLRMFDRGGVTGDAITRGGELAVSSLTPEMRQMLMTQGVTGISALGDVIAAKQRGYESLADIASGTAASRASALVGAVPTLQQFAQTGQEARLLSGLAGQQARTRGIESLAKLAGKVF